jgi:uncharacterized protein YcbX
VGEVVWLARYPVKSMLGEDLRDAGLEVSGILGDRRFALIDAETGFVASAKYPRKWRALLTVAARYRDGGRQVRVTLPGGAAVDSDDPAFDAVLSRFLGRPVRLSRARDAEAMLERETPEVEAGAGTLTHSGLSAGAPGGGFVDFAAVHVVTTATLGALRAAHPRGAVDARRFRPNIVVRMLDAEPFVENTWPGRTLSVGDGAALRVITPTPRCPVPGLAHGADLPDDPDTLRTAARLNRVPVFDAGRLTCVGAYASVDHGGRLRVGDRVLVR